MPIDSTRRTTASAILVTSILVSVVLVMTFTVENAMSITLPAPSHEGDLSVEAALLQRRSVRSFSDDTLSLPQLSQLLWACQGTTSDRGFRTAPSAGALYPLEVYVVVERVEDLARGVYWYRPGQNPGEHSLELITTDRGMSELADAALGQNCLQQAACCLVITGEVTRTEARYRERAGRYMLLEAGHAAQNVCLQVEALQLGMVTVGAFHDSRIAEVLQTSFAPLYLLPVGVPQ